jgi:pimeloyl-ACP methyl ester carboxylesterase
LAQIRIADLPSYFRVVLITKQSRGQTFRTSGEFCWAERAYPKLIHYNKLDKGGHFAAWEQPQLFTEEVRAGFTALRPVAS